MATISSINPATGAVQYEPLAETSSAELQDVVERSRQAFSSWASTPAAKRAVVLRQIALALEDQADDLAALADSETALGIPRLVGEVARTVFQIRMFATELDNGELLASHVDEPVEGPPPAGRPRLSRRVVPIGPVAVFGASNFPFAFAELGGDTASALAAGCTVVVKEHPGHPQLAATVVEVAREAISSAGADPDILQGVRGLEAGRKLVSHPAIRAAGFTGSEVAGRALFDLAVSRPQPIPFYGELGSVNPVFISQATLDERFEAVAADAAGSITLGRGQFCTKPSLIFVPQHDGFLEALRSEIAGVSAGPLLAPSSADRFMASVKSLQTAPGITELVAPSQSEDRLEIGASVLSVSMRDFLAQPESYLTECFGPTALLVICESEDDFRDAIDHLEGALVATIQAVPGRDDALVGELVQSLSEIAGRIVMNAWPTGLAVTPWQHHGGPYPASTSPLHTSVGLQAMMRFVRPVVLQNASASDWPSLVATWES